MENWYAEYVFKKTGQEKQLLSSKTFSDAVGYWLSQNASPSKQQNYREKKEKQQQLKWNA